MDMVGLSVRSVDIVGLSGGGAPVFVGARSAAPSEGRAAQESFVGRG